MKDAAAAQEALVAAAEEFGEAEFSDLIEVRSLVEVKIKPGMTKEQYVGVLGVLGGRSKMLQWIIGDLIVYGEKAFGEEYAQLVEALGLAPGTLAQYAWVAKNIPPSRRVEGVDFSVHRLVGKFEPKVQTKYLTLSRRDGLGSRQVREQMVADGILEERPKKSAVEKFQAVWHVASNKAREEIAGLIDEWRAEAAAKVAAKGKAKTKATKQKKAA
jgi:hypothetical protein